MICAIPAQRSCCMRDIPCKRFGYIWVMRSFRRLCAMYISIQHQKFRHPTAWNPSSETPSLRRNKTVFPGNTARNLREVRVLHGFPAFSPKTKKCRKVQKSRVIKPKGSCNLSMDCRSLLVPPAGIEPARYRYRGILSPLRLPVPPWRRTIKYNSRQAVLSIAFFA